MEVLVSAVRKEKATSIRIEKDNIISFGDNPRELMEIRSRKLGIFPHLFNIPHSCLLCFIPLVYF